MTAARWERLLSGLLVVATGAIAVAVVRREFFPSSQVPAPKRESRFVRHWDSLLTAGWAVGPREADIRLIVFTDFECPYCRAFDGTARKVLAAYPARSGMVYVHYPLPNHRFARPAARWAECAGRLDGRFSEIAKALFAGQDSFGLKPWDEFAKSVGVRNPGRLERCTRDSLTEQALERGLTAGSQIGIVGTPVVILNGWLYGSPPSEENLTRDIEALLSGNPPHPEVKLHQRSASRR